MYMQFDLSTNTRMYLLIGGFVRSHSVPIRFTCSIAGVSCGVVAHEKKAIPNKKERKIIDANFTFMISPEIFNENTANNTIRQVISDI
jgi:hypothetical protein